MKSLSKTLSSLIIILCLILTGCSKDPNELFLSKTSVILEVNQSETIIASHKEQGEAAKNIIWESSNNSIATVENGVIKGISKGSTIIKATFKDITKQVNVTVNDTAGDLLAYKKY